MERSQSAVVFGAVLLTEATGTVADSSETTFTICNKPFVSGFTHGLFLNARDLTTADFNEDGDLDLAVAVEEGVAVSLGKGDGTFATPSIYAMATYGRGVVTDDFDEDGILDLAVTYETGVGIFYGQGAGGVGNGLFGNVKPNATGADVRGVARGDFNEDGIVDLAVACGGNDWVSILLGSGLGGVGDGGFAAPVPYVTSGAPTRIVVADFDGDTISDLAVSCQTGGTFTVLLGDGSNGVGDGTFTTTGNGWATIGPRGLASGDFNEDGDVDLAIGNSSADISICLGNGDGTFDPPVTVDGEGGNRDFTVGDFTGDGITDLVAAAGDYNQMSLYAGNGTGEVGDGTFDFIATYATGSVPEAIVSADFDEDGRVDLMTANRGSNSTISLSGNLGSCQLASFGLTLVSPVGGEIWAIGSTQTIQWLAGGGISAVNVEVSRDGGANWELLAENVTGSSYAWDVTPPVDGSARVRVTDVNQSSATDQSNGAFTIANPTGVETQPSVPRAYALHPAKPNPFNPSTTYGFDLPVAARVSLRVYDVAGRLVRTLWGQEALEAGFHRVVWNGKDERGAEVASGVYMVRLNAGTFTKTQRAVLLK